MRVGVSVAGSRLLVLFALAMALVGARQFAGSVPSARRSQPIGALPLSFEQNDGQLDARVRFVARQSASDIFLTDDGLLVALKSAARERQEISPAVGDLLRLRWVDGDAKQIAGLSKLPGRASYFRGKNPGEWRVGVPTFSEVKYSELYPGVDLLYYGNQQRLEYDLIVAPGAEVGRIRLALDGVSRAGISSSGELLLEVGGRTIRQPPPRAYQDAGGKRLEIRGEYLLVSEREVAFRLGEYDRTKPLVIDPILDFSTYLGGSTFDFVRGVAVDGQGNIYLVGGTGSLDLPVTQGAAQPNYGGGRSDAFVMKLSPNGSTAIYTTYLGGSDEDLAYAVGVDRLGQAYVTGYTLSTDFPVVNARQDTLGGGGGPDAYDAFVTKLNDSGTELVYSTYLGGSDADSGKAIAVDGDGNAYIAGFTNSRDFPVTANAYQPNFGGPFSDGFVARLNADGSEYFYVTYFGGRLYDAALGIATDGDGNAYVVGETGSPDFPTRNPIFPNIAGGGGEFGDEDAFLAKFNWDGSLVYSTFLGGSAVDRGRAVAVDRWGNAYVTGDTVSSDFPAVNALQPQRRGSVDAFATKVNVEGTALVYSTYLGGSGLDQGYGIAVDSDGLVTLTGSTNSTDFPTASPIQEQNGGSDDVFVSQIRPDGSALSFSTYLGGRGQDIGFAVAVDGAGNPVVAGSTTSSDFPTRNSVRDYLSGWPNGFAAKLSADSP